MTRLEPLDPEKLSIEQRRIFDDILKSRGGNIGGPFEAWLRSPELADPAQRLGAFCRYHSSLEPRLSELAILITAAEWRANVEWFIHAPIARDAGLDDNVIDALLAGRTPDFKQSDEAAVYACARELYRDKRVSEATYQQAANMLGQQSLVELIGILGYYALVAMTLNAFEVGLPQMTEPPFPG